MRVLATILHRLRQTLAAPVDDPRLPPTGNSDQAGADNKRADHNRFLLLRIICNILFLLAMAGIGSNVDHLKMFEQLLNICSVVNVVFALVMREKWSLSMLSRWDEAIIFGTLSLGLRLFA